MIRRLERCAWRRAVRALVLCAALAAAAPAAAQRGGREVKIAVLPVVVHAMEQQDYLRSGLGDMLASRLGQHRGLAVLRMEDPARATTDSDAARAAGRAAGADWVLFGSFTQFGTGASLDLRCLPAARATSINYVQVVFAAGWGWLWFAETISAWQVGGGMLVLAATLISLSARR